MAKTKMKKIEWLNLSGLFIAIILIVLCSFNVRGVECNGTLSHPAKVELDQTFNVNFFNGMSGWTGSALLSWTPSNLTSLTANPQATAPFTTTTWTMNSSVPGNYTISVFVVNSATGENCTKNSSILIVSTGKPFLLMNLLMPSQPYMAKRTIAFNVNITNVGNDTAKNVTSYLIGPNVSPSSRYLGDISSSTQRVEPYDLLPTTCGSNLLIGRTKYNEYYYAETQTFFDVIGSDLQILDLSFTPTSVREGKNVAFTITIKNQGFEPWVTNATNVVVKIYRGSKVIKTIDFGTLEVNETKTITETWKSEGKGFFIPYAVVDSANECENGRNNQFNASSSLTIRASLSSDVEEETEEGYCGNGKCEENENEYSCPQDCRIIINQIIKEEKPGQKEETIIQSDDGKVLLIIPQDTIIKLNNRIVTNPKEVININNAPLPYPLQKAYLIRNYNFAPDGLTFDKEVVLIMKYNEREVSKKARAYIVTFDKKKNEWVTLNSIDEKELKQVKAKITHFSDFALVSSEKQGITGASIMAGMVGLFGKPAVFYILIVILIIVIILTIIQRKRKGKRDLKNIKDNK